MPAQMSAAHPEVNDHAQNGVAKPLSYGSSPAAQAAMAASESNRRLDGKKRKKARYSDTIVVTITKPMLYHFDAPLIQRLVNQGSFDLLSDGRERTHGPVSIKTFHLRDNPKYHPQSAAVMPWVAAGLACALLTLAVPTYLRMRRSGYTKVGDDDNLYLGDAA